MHISSELVERFPDAASESLVATMTGHILAVHLQPKRKRVRCSAYLTDAALYIERRSFLHNNSYHRLPIDKIDDFGWGTRPSNEQLVVLLGVAGESYGLFFPVDNAESTAAFVDAINDVIDNLTADPTSTLSQARQAGFEKKANMAHLLVTGWELAQIPEGDTETEARAMDAKAAIFESDPEMINRVIAQFEKFETSGLDTTMTDVQTMALRRAGYLRARGLGHVMVDFDNPK